MSTPLDTSVTAQFLDDGAGGTIARAISGPTVFGSRWEITSISVSTTSTALSSSVFKLYRNNEGPSGFLEGTYSGDSDTSDTNLILGTLDKLIFVWTGGTLGSYATGSLRGNSVGR
jgi:hypothetical protein